MQILFEDNHLLVVNKPVNVPVMEDESGDPDCLSLLKEYLKEKYHKPGNVYLGLVHRLDRPVGGVVVFAKTSKAASRLSESMRKNEFEKVYLAVVEGTTPTCRHLQDYLYKDTKTNMVSIVGKDKGKPASLDYETIATINGLSLVRIHLQTGRSHQIRVQMAHDSHPLYGDQRYNPNAKVHQQIALFAAQLSFPHPISRERLTFKAATHAKPFDLFDQKGN